MKKGFVICILLVMLLSSCGQKKVNIPIGSDHTSSIYSGFDNVAELKKEIISAIKTEAMVAVGTTE